MAEEREAWVQTLKNQLNQRDQITQEMETHFSSRLKDLEYRWAQEKAGLESALKEREAEVLRVRQEVILKSEQEKGFWEDRVRTLNSERDKMERELDRIRDKFQQEKDQLIQERQSIREEVKRVEGMLKIGEEQARAEKGNLQREIEALKNFREIQSKEIVEKSGQLEGMKSQLSA